MAGVNQRGLPPHLFIRFSKYWCNYRWLLAKFHDSDKRCKLHQNGARHPGYPAFITACTCWMLSLSRSRSYLITARRQQRCHSSGGCLHHQQRGLEDELPFFSSLSRGSVFKSHCHQSGFCLFDNVINDTTIMRSKKEANRSPRINSSSRTYVPPYI